MKRLLKTNLGFFMDLGGSLETWERIGTLKREVALYNLLAKKFKRIYFFTYGTRRDLEYAGELASNIKIIPRPECLPAILWEFLMPLRHWRRVRQCAFLKTNQNSGALAAVGAKVLAPKAKLVVRSGYIGSEFAAATRFPRLAAIYFALEQGISYRLCNLAFIPTKANYLKLLKKYPWLKKRLKIINNFIDTELFRRKMADPQYDLIYVARLDAKQKNQQLLLEAGKDQDWKILFIGQGPEKENYEQQARENNGDLTIVERVANEELPDYYNNARVFASPSLFEGNPKAILEAMSAELPVVALAVPGVKNIIESGRNGVLTRNDVMDFREKINQVLADETLQRELGKKARRFVVKEFALDNVFSKEYKLYEKLLNKGDAKKSN